MDQKLSKDAFRSSVSQKAARLGSCNFLVKMEKFLQNFQVSKIDDFHSKSLNFAENHRSEVLSHRAPEDTIRKDFVHTFKFLNRRAPQKYLHTPGTPYVSAKNSISTSFPLSQHIAKLLKKYCIKTFSIILILFFSKTPEKVGFLKKSMFESDAHSALWWRVELSQLGTGFGQKKASFLKAPPVKVHAYCFSF